MIAGIELMAACAVATACAMLSPIVVARRWALLGEGIGHSGLGGAGTAWMLMALLPGSALDQPWLVGVLVVVASIGAALGMGAVSRRSAIGGDAAVGIFLVATVAWGFLGQHAYRARLNAEPVGFTTLLFGQPATLGTPYAIAAIAAALAIVATLVALRKEILAYCVDPSLAEVSGVRVGLIHYTLILLVALATIIGMQVVGSLLVTALLVLPGTTANLLTRRLAGVVGAAVGVGLIGAVGGSMLHALWPLVPAGPAFVLVMVALFAIAFVARART